MAEHEQMARGLAELAQAEDRASQLQAMLAKR